ncbi:hypothetical protein [Microbispora bryophytorum]|uniref:hypothetical protein n=1 Tax=Microbispora bryophytorum TaxID=1460882 RepID=UPI0033F7DAFA
MTGYSIDTSEVEPANLIQLAEHLLDGLRITAALRDKLGSSYADVYHRQFDALHQLLTHLGHDHDFILLTVERTLGNGQPISSALVGPAAKKLAETICEHFGGDPDYAPEVMEPGWDAEGGRVIVWSDGVPDWAYLVRHGGASEYSGSTEFAPLPLPDGVRVEVVSPVAIRVLPA